MMQKTPIGIVVALVVLGGVTFYGGMRYERSRLPEAARAGRALNREWRQQRLNDDQPPRGMRNGGGLVAGVILSKDATSITVKLRNGGSQIVLTPDSADIGKTTTGSRDDLAVDTNVVITGTTNTDGSVTAQSIQIRPE